MSSRFSSFLEPLESRIAPAAVVHPLPDIVAGAGQSGTTVDLSKLLDFTETGSYANRTLVTIETNFDIDPDAPGIQPGLITIELYDDLAPLTVQNFLRYALNKNANGDYDGTFFHRIDTKTEGVKVLQGGGFQLDGKAVEHIDTLPEVHNEYDPSRPNERGTLALAKTGLGPNTGTSEWYINLGDNSETLGGENNGGFTVFGRVIDKPGVVDGMEVVDMLGQLPTVTGIVGNFPTPLQNYDSDPDNNPQTPAPAIDPGDLITIRNIVVEQTKGTDSGISYEYVGAKVVENGVVTAAESKLLIHKLTGSDLNLKYAPGETGVAEVSVRVTQGDFSEIQKFFVTVEPNLITSFAANALAGAVVPGDTANVKLNLTNTGGGLASGEVDVKFYFAKSVLSGGQYQVVEPLVRLEANTETVPVTIGSGKTVTITVPVNVPSELVTDQSIVYQLFAEIVPKGGTLDGEMFDDDNATLQSGGVHQIFNAFGNIGDKNKPLTYTDADGDKVVLSLKGKGYGQLFLQPDGSVDVTINGTNAKTKIVAKKSGALEAGDVSFRNIESATPLNSLDLELLDVSGNLVFSGGIKTLKMGDITGGPSTMSIGFIPGAEKTRTSLSFGSVKELTLDSSMPISSLKAAEWLDREGGQDSITAPSLQSLTIGTPKSGSMAEILGDLEANVDVTTSAAVKKFTVTGLLNDSTVRIYGNVGKVVLGGIHDSSFLVGTNSIPATVEDFNEDRTIGSFTVTGLAAEPFDFVNSTVAAIRFLNVNLAGTVDADSGSGRFGIVADVINKYRSLEERSLKPLTAPDEFDEQGNYVVQIV